MAIRKIFKINDQEELAVLRKVSKPVDNFDARLNELIDDMKDTLKKANGAGLSAVQVGILKRVFIIIDDDGTMKEFINPQILEQSGKNPILDEGCLSVPGKYAKVDRPNRVVVKAQNKAGEEFIKEYTGFLAKAICHESDHLDGILYIDKVRDPKEKKRKDK